MIPRSRARPVAVDRLHLRGVRPWARARPLGIESGRSPSAGRGATGTVGSLCHGRRRAGEGERHDQRAHTATAETATLETEGHLNHPRTEPPTLPYIPESERPITSRAHRARDAMAGRDPNHRPTDHESEPEFREPPAV